jgi:glycerol kinase
MDYILSLDQGTTSSRAILFDRAGHPVATAQYEFAQHFPQPGWVEHDALDLWNTQREVMQRVLREAHVSAHQVAAVGLTNQRETTVLWDRHSGQPLAPAIVWQDRRTAAQCEGLRAAGKAGLIQHKTGLVIDAYFSATKLQWLLDRVPGARARAERGELAFGTVDSWLLWNLTGGRVHATDPSNASRTMLFNIRSLAWDAELLELFDIPESLLPEVLPSSAVLGHLLPELLGRALPVAGMAGDQQAATFGQACFAPGMAKNTYGTGCFMLMNTGNAAVASRNRLLTTVGWQGPGQADHRTAYCLEGSVFMGGATVQWLRDGLQIIQSAGEVEALAASVAHTDDLYLVPAFAGLGAPDWDGFARGTLVGMTRGSGRAQLARAALEAIALQSADVFGAMERDSGVALRELRVDGGAAGNNLLMQMQADYLGVPVLRPQVTETTALGAACLAALAVGFWADAREISAQWKVDRIFEPNLGAAERVAKLARWRQAVDRAKGWAQPGR